MKNAHKILVEMSERRRSVGGCGSIMWTWYWNFGFHKDGEFLRHTVSFSRRIVLMKLPSLLNIILLIEFVSQYLSVRMPQVYFLDGARSCSLAKQLGLSEWKLKDTKTVLCLKSRPWGTWSSLSVTRYGVQETRGLLSLGWRLGVWLPLLANKHIIHTHSYTLIKLNHKIKVIFTRQSTYSAV